VTGARRLHGEGGYAMVATITITMILTLLLVVILGQALHSNEVTTVAVRRAQALGVAEGGVSWAIATLEADRAAAMVTNREVRVADGSGGEGTATVTVRLGTPTVPGKLGYYTIYSTGRSATAAAPTRTVRVVLGPAPSFRNALYAGASLTLQKNACIVGGVYARGDIFFKGNSTIAGTANARGSLVSESGVISQFGAATSPNCPASVDGEPVDDSLDIHGDVLAGGASPAGCRAAPAGAVNDPAGGYNLNGARVGGRVCNDPIPTRMPDYHFDPALYARVQYYGSEASPSATAVADFNAALRGGTLPATGGALDRTYVIWQDLTSYRATGTTPPAIELDAGTLEIASDTVIYTNVPVDFGNTTTVAAAQPCSTADPPPAGTPACPVFQVITAYGGPDSPCSGGVGNCPAIFGGNQILFEPEVAMLLYSKLGTVQLKNQCNSSSCNDSNHGAVYASTIDAKNNLNISYTPRVAFALGFGGVALQQHSWEEQRPCPAGQTPPC
jgi:hypothetical protein